MGRWQWLSNLPPILIDSAHNKEGLQPVLKEISNMGFQKIHFVLGFSADKDLDAILPMFPEDAKYYYSKAKVPRGMDRLVLKEKASQFGLRGKAYVSIKSAFAAARKKQKANELIFVGGSIFTIAEVM
jgi:dihydrofolate synthase/folylpolyglutamate synthase